MLVSRVIVAITVSVAVLGFVLTVLISARLISQPIRSMTELMRRLAEGELGIEAGDVERRDEIGAMARALEVFRANAVMRARAEEALRESMETSDDIIQAMPSGLFTYQYVPPDQMYLLDSNPEAEVLTGISAREWRGKEFNEIWPEARASGVTEAFLNAARSGETFVTESLVYEDERIEGAFRVRAFRMPGDRLGVAFEDVSERRLMEAQLQEYTQQLEHLVAEKVRELDEERAKLIQAGKMAALGQLATGVAHELNQPLTAILLDGEYLRRLTQPPEGEQSEASLAQLDELRRIGEDIVNDVTRCTRIIDHLRTFSRAAPLEPIPTGLNGPIEDSLILVGQRLREHGVGLQLSLAPDLPPILADPHRLEQVFLNLISNAEFALDEMERRVEAGEVESDGYQKRLEVSTLLEGDAVVAIVRDNGCGMSASDQEHVFEPFFTTKPVGEGTGIGLSISYGIVADFGGEISFESAENAGTTFRLSFPAAEQ
jgi:histidine kinase